MVYDQKLLVFEILILSFPQAFLGKHAAVPLYEVLPLLMCLGKCCYESVIDGMIGRVWQFPLTPCGQLLQGCEDKGYESSNLG